MIYAKNLPDEVIIIPSSVHEVILLPIEMKDKVDEINAIIQTINKTMLAPEEILSDHAYLYKSHVYSVL